MFSGVHSWWCWDLGNAVPVLSSWEYSTNAKILEIQYWCQDLGNAVLMPRSQDYSTGAEILGMLSRSCNLGSVVPVLWFQECYPSPVFLGVRYLVLLSQECSIGPMIMAVQYWFRVPLKVVIVPKPQFEVPEFLILESVLYHAPQNESYVISIYPYFFIRSHYQARVGTTHRHALL